MRAAEAYLQLVKSHGLRVVNAWSGVADAQVSVWRIQGVADDVARRGMAERAVRQYAVRCRAHRLDATRRQRAKRRAEWYAANRAEQNARQVARNNKRRATIGGGVAVSLRDVVAHHGAWCAYCGDTPTTVEHVTPVSAGGDTSIDNCVPACRTCNISKGPRPLVAWMARRRKRRNA